MAGPRQERSILYAILTALTLFATLGLVAWRAELVVPKWLFVALALPWLAFSIVLRIRSDTLGREGRYLDLWSIPHFLGGVLLGLLDIGFVSVLVLVIWWELVEVVSRVFEHPSNRVMDVVLALAGWSIACAVT